MAISWKVGRDNVLDRSLFVFDWIEHGGPAVTPPERCGFGTRLIEIGLSGSSSNGSVELSYPPEGVRCRIVAPLNDLKDADVRDD